MSLLIVAYFGGVLTILSPCILPVLPFVFARAGRPFVSSTLPMLGGMAITFASVATLAAVGGSWAVHVNEYGRYAAIALLALFGVTLISSRAAAILTGPIVALGNRLLSRSGKPGEGESSGKSFVLGVATGLLWAPCAGPILGLVLTGAALQGANVETTLLLLAYSAGAATSLAVALLVGGRVFALMKQSLGSGEWVRRGLGAAVLTGVTAIALGLDTGVLARLSISGTTTIEQSLLDRFKARTTTSSVEVAGNSMSLAADDARQGFSSGLPVEGQFPSLDGAVEWLNSPPLSSEQLRGKVVLVDFWTYSCINCIRTVPYVRAWAEKYKDQGLVVIGVHSPEFAFEKKIDNVKEAIDDFKIGYPVAIDNDFKIWRAFQNSYWPAHYFIDAKGQVRHHHFGEGDYAQSEKVIQDLLAEAGALKSTAAMVKPDSAGAEIAPDLRNIRSSETYIGYQRASNFISPEGLNADVAQNYTMAEPNLNEWGLTGMWTVGAERGTLNQSGGTIAYRFSARDLHLVLGPDEKRGPVRFQVTVDGKPPGKNHGADVDENGIGTVKETRLYQLVRQTGNVAERTFEVRFLDPGVQAFVFTFG
ncbi:cytochrome c biogenesis protein DipZ [Pararhizobium sp. PWRC1-1]|uniref:cytochrome c biogenesis protein DipZ n=1 Tax=Pararhizobium sp. PWRC1-1 TaxID=2804566 RepID=UPI003CF4D191